MSNEKPVLVLLTDDDDGYVLVRCPSSKAAEELGAAAIWSSGGVSAWLVEPEHAVELTPAIIETLREGGYLGDVWNEVES